MKKIYVLLGVFILLVLGYLLTIDLKITLTGNESITLLVNDSYQELGYSACYQDIFGFCLSKKEAKLESNVDTNIVGDYEVNYKVGDKEIIRKVSVIDDQKPEILVDIDKIKVCPNEKDIDIKYEVKDNYDKNVTVKKEIIDNEIVIEAIDSSSNKTTKKIPIEYVDENKPSLTLKGDSTIYVLKGKKYFEPGYSAKDDCLGDISKNVKVTQNINTNKEGTYKITYSVSDGINKTEKTRTVKVYKPNPDVSLGKKIIYLTFDDGPSGYTDELLDILKEYNVKATFFVTKNGSDSVIKRAYNEGHSIGLHTYTHNYNEIYKSVDAYFKDLEKIQNRVKRITGYESKIVRFPGGSSNTVSYFNRGIMTKLSKELEVRGYKYFDWNVGSSDTATSNKNTIANNVIKRLNGGNNIVLQHDTKYASVLATRKIIEYGLANGYTFAKLDITSPTVHHAINN